MIATTVVILTWSLVWRVPYFVEGDGAAVASRLGFSAESLAAAGCDETSASEILAAIEGAPEGIAQLSQLDSAWGIEADAATDLIDQLRDPAGCSAQQVTDCAAAQAELSATESQIQDTIGTLREAALSACPPETAALVVKFTEAAEAPALPIRMFAGELSEEQREDVAVAQAMANLAEQMGQEPEPDHVALIEAVESDPAVEQAQENLDSNFEEVSRLLDDPH